MASVAEIDSLAQQLFTGPDPAVRQQAHDCLSQHTQEGSNSSALIAILAESNNQYALMFAAQGSVAWLKANLKYTTKEKQVALVVESCGTCLKRISCAGAPRHVVMALISTFAKMTKLLFDKEPYLTEAADFAIQLLHVGEEKLYFTGLLLLDAMVNEFSKYDSSKVTSFMGFSTHRRCSNNFRDECMLRIFTESLTQLRQLSPSGYAEQVVELVKDCLTYDFMAIMVDETEDALSSQIPSSWKELLLSESTRDILWGQHESLPYPYCATLLTGLTSLCGIRRTFFEATEDRIAYLDGVLGRLTNIMNSTDGRLCNSHYVQVFAEACVRLVPPFGYCDLHRSRFFAPWLEAVRAVSLDVFQIPFGQDGSFTTASTLMNFWARITTSRRMYMHAEDSPKDLELISPSIALNFFQSRVKALLPDNSNVNCSAEEEDSGAVEVVLTQSESFASVVSLSPPETLQLLADYVNQQLGPRVLQSPPSTAWLFFCAGSLVRQILSSIEEDAVGAATRFFLFCVDGANHRRLAAGQAPSGPGSLYGSFVERALLSFLTSVQAILANGARMMSSQNMVVTNVFQSRAQLFQFLLNNTGHNIMRPVSGGSDEDTAEIIKSSIALIGDACRDAPSAILRELNFDLPPAVDLPLAQSTRTYKLRSNLYAVMWPLAHKDPYHIQHLKRFLAPIDNCIQNTLSGSGGSSALFVAGWMRDLRGLTVALQEGSNGEAFADYLEWFCEQATAFQSILASPVASSPMVIVSFLRWMIGMVDNRGGRVCLHGCGNHSALGLMLFKHLCCFIQQIVERCITEEHIQAVTQGDAVVDGAYELMMKPLALSMTCMRKCVGDTLFPFGAMWFYNDDTYDVTLLGLLRMLVVFPPTLLKQYNKVSYSVVDLLRAVSETDCFLPLAKLSMSDMQTIIGFVVSICENVDTQTGTLLHALSFLAYISGFLREVKELTVSPALGPMGSTGTPPPPAPSSYLIAGSRISGTPGGLCGNSGSRTQSRSTRLAREAVAHILHPIQDLWLRLITVAMNVIVCQDRALSVSCSVVYPIFEAHPPFWHEFVDAFVPTYPERKQAQVREALATLSSASDSQERFFSEVFTFRQTLRNL